MKLDVFPAAYLSSTTVEIRHAPCNAIRTGIGKEHEVDDFKVRKVESADLKSRGLHLCFLIVILPRAVVMPCSRFFLVEQGPSELYRRYRLQDTRQVTFATEQQIQPKKKVQSRPLTAIISESSLPQDMRTGEPQVQHRTHQDNNQARIAELYLAAVAKVPAPEQSQLLYAE